MSTYFTSDFSHFFAELEINNDRQWFEQNKQRYIESVKEPMTRFVGDLLQQLPTWGEPFPTDPRKTMFRIYRDIRFSKNKTPYKTHASVVLSSRPRKDYAYPSLYLKCEADAINIFVGSYGLDTATLRRMREYMVSNIEKFNKIINKPAFKKQFGTIGGEKNKRLPKEWTTLAETYPYLYNKQFFFQKRLGSEVMLHPNLIDHIVEVAHIALPFLCFMAEPFLKDKSGD